MFSLKAHIGGFKMQANVKVKEQLSEKLMLFVEVRKLTNVPSNFIHPAVTIGIYPFG